LISTVDYPARLIYLSADTVDADLDTLDVYREVRALRRTTDAHQQFKPIIEGGGRIEKLPGVYTAAYARLLHGARIVPYDASHKIRLVRDTFTDDGVSGRDCFDRSGLTGGVVVDIDVDFPAVEIVEVGVGTPQEVAAAVWSQYGGSIS